MVKRGGESNFAQIHKKNLAGRPRAKAAARKMLLGHFYVHADVHAKK